MNTTNPLFKIGLNTIVQFSGKSISVILSAISIYILTRYLGISGYGNFSLVFAYLTFFSAFTDFGLQTTIVNKLSKKEITQESVFGIYLFTKMIIIFVTTLFSLVVLLFLPYSQLVKLAILFSSIGVAIGSLGGFGNTFFQYQLRLERITLIDVINRGLTVLFILIFSILKLGFFYILSAVIISNFLSIIIMFLFLKKDIRFGFSANLLHAVNLLKESAPIGIAAFLTITYFKLDTIMLSVFKNAKEVGIYSLSYKLFENVLIVWGFYVASFYPFLAKFYHSKSWPQYNNLIKNSIIISVVLSAIVTILGYYLSPALIRIFGGSGFSASVTPLRILLLSSFFIFINAIFYNYLYVKGRKKIVIIALSLSLIFNFLINLFIIPRFGYIGTSFTTVITEVFLLGIYLAYLPSVYKRL